MLLLIDNYDSFTYNLSQYFQILGATVKVVHHDKISLQEIEQLNPSHIVISPGPGTPDDAGISCDVIKYFAGKIPLLGVCLGHQCIGQVFGGKVIRANQVMHGKTSKIYNNGQALFAKLPREFLVTRYHSLLVEWESLPEELEVIAWTVDGQNQPYEIMGLMHKTLPIYGVQFHPEAILTEQGMELLEKFLTL
jgi:anthranilate synthase/aminodeoxychorismate synthase-like glutamine amidotransferase